MAEGKYKEWLEADNLAVLTSWSMSGLDLSQIADNMGISQSTLREWRKKYPAISAALKRGRAHADAHVENALYKRALGYDYTEDTYERRENKATGETEMTLIKQVKKHMPPDTTAQIFYLTNRKPDDWKRNRVEVTDDGGDTTTGVVLLPEATDGE